MSRRDDEPIFIAEFADRADAEAAWVKLDEADFAAAVITDAPPWGPAKHRVQVRRADASAAVAALRGEELA